MINNLTSSPLWRRVEASERNVCAGFMGGFPVSVGKIAAKLNLTVLSSTLPTGVSGEIRPSTSSKSGYEIRVNRHENKKRQRFTVAHEIGHYLLHREHINDGIVDNVLYRSGLSSRIEAEANRIAADILMPKHTLKAYLKQNYGNRVTETDLDNIANNLRVSKIALKIRLGL